MSSKQEKSLANFAQEQNQQTKNRFNVYKQDSKEIHKEKTTTTTEGSRDTRVTVATKMRYDQRELLQGRLKYFGFKTFTEFVNAFRDSQFPDPNVALPKKEEGGIRTGEGYVAMEGEYVPDLWNQEKDYERMYRWFHVDVGHSPKYSKDLVSYFRKYKNLFFGKEPESLFKFTPHKRYWILNAMRNFGKYCLRWYNTDKVKLYVSRIIEKYQLNKGLDMKNKVYLVDEHYLESKVDFIRKIPGTLGFIANFAIGCGLRNDEYLFMHDQPVCEKGIQCECPKLHTADKGKFIMVALNWFRGHKKVYFTILPKKDWYKFREMQFTQSEIDATTVILRKAKLAFKDTRKIHFNILSRAMTEKEVNCLQGRVPTVTAKHYAYYQQDLMVGHYQEAFNSFGVYFE